MLYLIPKNYSFLTDTIIDFELEKDFIKFNFKFDYTDDDGNNVTLPLLHCNITTDDILKSPDKSDNSFFGWYIRTITAEVLDTFMMTIINNTTRAPLGGIKWKAQDLEMFIKHYSSFSKDGNNEYHHNYIHPFIINATALSYINKTHFNDIYKMVNGIRFLHIFVPFLDKLDFTKCIVGLSLPHVKKLNYNGETITIDYEDIDVHKDFWTVKNVFKPALKIKEIKSNSNNITINDPNKPLEFEIELFNGFTNETITDINTEIYIETVNGYVPKNRVKIDPKTGKARFKAYPEYLESGDTMRIKVGFKHFTSLNEAIINIE